MSSDTWQTVTNPARTKVIVDPDEVLALDINRTNNSRSLQPQTAAAASAWSWRWLVWAQDLLMT